MGKITFSKGVSLAQKRKVLNRMIEVLIEKGLRIYENVDSSLQIEFVKLLHQEVNSDSYPDSLLVAKYYKTLMSYDIAFVRDIQKTLSTDKKSFETYVALMERNIEASENIRRFNALDSNENKKVNVTLYYTKKECLAEFCAMLKSLHQAPKLGFKEVFLNGYFIYIVQDSFARKTTKVIYDACEKFFGKDLVAIAYRKEASYLEAFNIAWMQSPVLVDEKYPIFMYYDKYEMLKNNQTAFNTYKYDRVLEKDSYWKGWARKNGLGKIERVEELTIEDGFGVPQKEVKKITLADANSNIIFLFKDIDANRFGEPHLLINTTGDVNQYVIGIENIKNHL